MIVIDVMQLNLEKNMFTVGGSNEESLWTLITKELFFI